MRKKKERKLNSFYISHYQVTFKLHKRINTNNYLIQKVIKFPLF